MKKDPTEKGQWSGQHLQGAFDAVHILGQIGVTRGQTLLDAGSGEGRFALPAASMVGEGGKVYAVDSSQERIQSLRRQVQQRGLGQVETLVADVTEHIGVPAGSVDVCLMANVFHELAENGQVRGELREMKRLLRPDGLLAILDFRKDVDRPPGPPLSRRVDPREVQRLVAQHGFHEKSRSEVGRYHYLSIFTLCANRA
jgi:ubiquinone/menaquinone biosynthesis C-methylase UbiE